MFDLQLETKKERKRARDENMETIALIESQQRLLLFQTLNIKNLFLFRMCVRIRTFSVNFRIHHFKKENLNFFI